MRKFAPNFEIIMADLLKTEQQFKDVMSENAGHYLRRSFMIMEPLNILRPSSLTDQLYIKAKRIRSLEIKNLWLAKVSVRSSLPLSIMACIGLIQLEKPFVDEVDMTPEEAMKLYDLHAKEALELMLKKNHDYDEAWRSMRVSSYTDFILTKIQRVKEIEDIAGATLVSEGIDANYMDIINYAVFGAIKMSEK